jgi:hypothetical protein
MRGQRHQWPHQVPRQHPDRDKHDDAGDKEDRDEARSKLVDDEERFVLGIDAGDDPVRRRYALVGDERVPAVEGFALLGALVTFERAFEQRILPGANARVERRARSGYMMSLPSAVTMNRYPVLPITVLATLPSMPGFVRPRLPVRMAMKRPSLAKTGVVSTITMFASPTFVTNGSEMTVCASGSCP